MAYITLKADSVIVEVKDRNDELIGKEDILVLLKKYLCLTSI